MNGAINMAQLLGCVLIGIPILICFVYKWVLS